MFRRRLSTNLCLFLIVMIGNVHKLDGQVSIRERVPINPADGNGGQRNTVLDVPDIYWIAPRNGMVQLEVNRVTRILAPTPDTAYVRIKHGSMIDTTNIWQYFNASNQTNASDSNLCNHTKVTVPWYWDGNAAGNPQKLFFLNVSVGDTLRFWYQAGLNNPTTNITYDQYDSVWTVEMRSASCYKFYSDQEYCASYLNYADTSLYGFQVWTADTIGYGTSTIARAVATSNRGREVPLSGSTLLKYVENPSQYSRFILPTGDTSTAATITNIRYDDARSGKIQVFANFSSPDSINAIRMISIYVKEQADTTKNGTGTVVIRRKLLWIRFSQDSSSWANDDYGLKPDTVLPNGDTIWYDISEKGCALTSAAMILKAFGVDIDPGRLNEFLRNPGYDSQGNKLKPGYDGNKILWEMVLKFAGQNFVDWGKARGDGIPESGPLAPHVYSLDNVDPYLNSDSYGVTVQVYNPTTSANHWVVLTGKTGNVYNILDPGYSSRTNLDAYSGKIYKMVVFKKR